jgi:hypothetical protein
MDFYNKYTFVIEDESLYSNAAYREAYANYRGNHGGKRKDNDPLEMLVDVMGKSIADTLKFALSPKNIDKIVRDAVIKTGGEWTDD